MGGLLEFLEQPVVAASAAALMVVGFLLAIIFFVRSSRALPLHRSSSAT